MNPARLEFERIMKASYARAVSFSPFFYSGKIVVYFTFLTYVLMGNKLTAEIVFVTISLYNSLRLAVVFRFPFAVQLGSEALVAMDRIQVQLSFLELSNFLVTGQILLIFPVNV